MTRRVAYRHPMRVGRMGLAVPIGLARLWRHLRPMGRLALVGIVVATLATAILFAAAAGGRRAVLDAERLAIAAELAAVAAVLVDLGGRTSLDSEETAAVDALFERLLGDETRTGAKLWALDGTIIRSDTRADDGTRFLAAAPWIQGAADAGFAANDSEVDDPAGSDRPAYGDHVDLYVAVPHPDTGAPLAVVEVHENGPALAAVNAEGPGSWLTVGAAFFVLVMSIVAFVASTARVVGASPAAVQAIAATVIGDPGATGVLSGASGIDPVAAVPAPPDLGEAGPGPEVVADSLAAAPDLRLSRRQAEVLEALCAGLTAKEIAVRLGLAEGTVGVYTKELYRKLGVSSRAGAVAIALRRGLVR